jgi:hypothetical protein
MCCDIGKESNHVLGKERVLGLFIVKEIIFWKKKHFKFIAC